MSTHTYHSDIHTHTHTTSPLTSALLVLYYTHSAQIHPPTHAYTVTTAVAAAAAATAAAARAVLGAFQVSRRLTATRKTWNEWDTCYHSVITATITTPPLLNVAERRYKRAFFDHFYAVCSPLCSPNTPYYARTKTHNGHRIGTIQQYTRFLGK
ncbi:hypothetical protein WUBG_00183 [Wuchereria bancrofti]|uniref:Uncharacterized protein n=1 Tax=Wuchereria bancrofti TaxID=6293 RepID=J9FND3_WUCBA|nr:hypothetical protein WUBG_00183 [Wuchereria bancrofti]